uniref:Uncharacterized protein n=1 Tax=Homalodisca liturata TaxID=320908 RepID=A0A1B6IVF1_9HEMI
MNSTIHKFITKCLLSINSCYALTIIVYSFYNFAFIISVNFTFPLDVYDDHNLQCLDQIISTDLIQADVSPVLLQRNAYLYYETLQYFYDKMKQKDYLGFKKVMKIKSNGGPKHLNISIKTPLFLENEWSKFDLGVLHDILNGTREVWGKVMGLTKTIQYGMLDHVLYKLNSTLISIQDEENNYEQNNQNHFDMGEDFEKHPIYVQSDSVYNTIYSSVNHYNNFCTELTESSEQMRQTKMEKLKRQKKHIQLQLLARERKAQKQRKHLERIEQRRLMKEKKEERMERHKRFMAKNKKKYYKTLE